MPSTLHMRATMALGAALGLIAVLGPTLPAQAQDSPSLDPEAKAVDFWRGAARVASVAIHAPTARGLRRAGLAPLVVPMGNLQMMCRGQWTVNARYDALAGDGQATISQGSAGCLPDVGVDVTVAANPSVVGVAGGSLRISYLGCSADRAPEQPGTVEEACPVEQRLYGASGRLPAVGGRKAAHISVDAVGLSRAQLAGLLRSLRPVERTTGTSP